MDIGNLRLQLMTVEVTTTQILVNIVHEKQTPHSTVCVRVESQPLVSRGHHQQRRTSTCGRTAEASRRQAPCSRPLAGHQQANLTLGSKGRFGGFTGDRSQNSVHAPVVSRRCAAETEAGPGEKPAEVTDTDREPEPANGPT